MSKNKIPDRWQKYSAVGLRLPGTRFIAFKVPLKKMFERHLQAGEFFSPTDLLRQVKGQREELGKIIDLTYTKRYYDPKELPEGLIYEKIFTAGHEVPTVRNILTFKQAVQSFLSDNMDNDKLVGVHCTHGVNRTGYLICRYLIDVDGMEPHSAIDLFNKSRGYQIERQNYIQDLLQGPRRSNKGIDVPAPCPVTRQKEPHSQQAMFKQRERPYQGKCPTRNGFREFSQLSCPAKQSAQPYQPVQHPNRQWFGTGAVHHTVHYNGNVKTFSNCDYRRQELSWGNCQPESSRWSGQSESLGWSGQPESSRWSGQPESSRWSGQPGSSRWSGQPGSSQRSGQPESSRWSGQPGSSGWSGQPESSGWSGQPESSGWSGQPESSGWSGQPESSGWRGQSESSGWSGQSESSGWSGQSESSRRSGQPQSPWQSYQLPYAARGNRGRKLNSGGQDRLNTHLRWDN